MGSCFRSTISLLFNNIVNLVIFSKNKANLILFYTKNIYAVPLLSLKNEVVPKPQKMEHDRHLSFCVSCGEAGYARLYLSSKVSPIIVDAQCSPIN